MDVRDKVVAITGAARGLGQEFAVTLAAAGAGIIAADINSCLETVDLIKSKGGKAVGLTLDVGDAGSALAAMADGVRVFGRLDGLINNAALYGALHGGRFDAIDEEEWDACMAINVKGIWNCCKAAVRFSTISSAMTSGAGRSAASSSDSSFTSAHTSRLKPTLFASSS